MNILFFQNCISPHQMPYINELHKIEGIHDIYVIVPEADMNTRKNMGWCSSEYQLNDSKVHFLINSEDKEIATLLEKYNKTETWCLFSGINSFPFVSRYFKLSLRYHFKRGIITEPPFLYNHPLWQHAIRFAIKDWKYVKYIDKLFVMGNDFLSYYRFWSKKWDVIPFMYCTEWKERNSNHINIQYSNLKILFVGSLSRRKNVQLIIKAIEKLDKQKQKKIELGIIGDGDRKNSLIKLTHDKNFNYRFYGTLPMNKIPEIMQEYDILCLPSLHDGWGAVVNEAITLGLYALCSETCGSKYIIEKSNFLCGDIFKKNNPISLKEKIDYCLQQKQLIRVTTNERINWARENIKGNIISKYLVDNLNK